MADPNVQPFADHGLLFTFGDQISAELSRKIGHLVDRLDAMHLTGVVDLVPSYTTLVAIIDPLTADPFAIAGKIRELWNAAAVRSSIEESASHEIIIPVVYGGEYGSDLADVADHTGLTEEEVAQRHAGGRYVIGALGFAPGFSYLIGLPPELTTPRRATPRTSVPPGSVGIGGSQTGVYALPTPGGWSLIGRTPLRLFRPERAEPFLIRAGDSVRFAPISETRYAEIDAEEAQSEADTYLEDTSDAVFEVISPGLQTSVQDLGRPGMGRFGVSPGGAADPGALIAANRLLGNDDGTAALEITLVGPRLRVLKACQIAIAGADLGARVNGTLMPSGRPVELRSGDDLWFDQAAVTPAGTGRGARAYLAVGGGIDVPIVMGSRSTDLTAGFGGVQGRALRVGDRLSRGDASRQMLAPSIDSSVRTHMNVVVSQTGSARTFRIVRGSQADRFDPSAWNIFLEAEFTVSSKSNRLGLRLDGPSLTSIGDADVISEAIVTGTIQVTGSGQPIVMLPARATIGGYAKIATVISADLNALGQMKPGDRVCFSEVTADDAFRIAQTPSTPDLPPATLSLHSYKQVVATDIPQPSATLADAIALTRALSGIDIASIDLTLPGINVHVRLRRR